MSQELFEKVGQDLLAIAKYVTELEQDCEQKLYRAATMIQQLRDANASLMERIDEMAEETAAVEAKGLDGLRGLEGLRALANGAMPEFEQEFVSPVPPGVAAPTPTDDAEPDTGGWVDPTL